MGTEHEEAQTSAAEAAPGLAEGMRRLAVDGIELLRLRIELFGTEWQAEKLRIFTALTGLLLGILLSGAMLVMLCAAILLLCPPAWRWALALSLALVFGLLAALVWRRAIAQLRPPGGAFALTLAELSRDKEQFGGS